MAKKKTLSEYQAAFKNLLREMEQDLGTPCSSVFIRVSVQTEWGNHDATAFDTLQRRKETREVTCEISFGDSYALKI